MSDEVREQYEALPYPARNPEDEKERLVTTWPEELGQINHYCFRGRRQFGEPFRVLEAGGGTGDSTVYLAEQLRRGSAEIVHLDVSQASIDVACRRVEARRLQNVRFVQGSLLELPRLGLGTFDYINCTGVLHHLEEPERGLDALLGALAPDGAMNLLVYGRYGRTAIYMLQDAMRTVNADEPAMADKISRTRALLAALPGGNPWSHHRLRQDPRTMDTSELYDLFLHAQDRAYTVPELHDWIERRAGLHMQLTRLNVGRIAYRPESYITDPALLARVQALPAAERAALAELIAGDIDMHSFYATRSADTVAPLDPEYVPFFAGGFAQARAEELAGAFANAAGRGVQFTDPRSGLAGVVPPGRFLAQLFRHLDGERSLAEIFASARSADPALMGVSDAELMNDFKAVYDIFNSIDAMLLRHRSVPHYKSLRGAP